MGRSSDHELFIDPVDTRLTSWRKQQGGGGVDERQRREGVTCGNKQKRAEEERGMFQAQNERMKSIIMRTRMKIIENPNIHLSACISVYRPEGKMTRSVYSVPSLL